MDCGEEVSLLRGRLSRMKGIRDLSFDVIQARMTVEYNAEKVKPAEIESAVAALGMRCLPWEEVPRENASLWARHGRHILTVVSGVALAGGMALQAIHSGDLVQSLLAHQHGHHDLPLAAMVLFQVAMITGAIHALPKAWASLRALRPDMNLLVVLSLMGATALGEWTEAATLSFLFSLAAMLETWSMARARDAISKLLQVTPQVASVIHEGSEHGRHDGGQHEHAMPVEQVPVGALVRVKPGERIPCDGEVERGEALVNQALITGESAAVEKRAGDQVFAGTINENGMIEVRTTHGASDTTLSRMIRMVEESQSRRAPSEQFVEKFTRHYTPAVLLLAFSVAFLPPMLAGGSWSEWFYQGMVILLISCPCALVISTPVSVVAALTSAARQGVLVKGGAFLEEAAKVKAVAFDKTGILTLGKPRVEELAPLNGRGRTEILERLARLEQASEHPLAQAILRYAAQNGVSQVATESFRALQGRGAEAEIDGETFWVGSARLLREKGLATEQAEREIARLTDAEHTVVACGTEHEAWALVAVTDPPRQEARPVLERLRKSGIGRLIMLTGDNQATAKSIANAVGVTEVQAELLPEDKATAVVELLRRHRHVAMVGDGVNDAQALSFASLGITLGRQGSDVAKETADVVFMSNDLTRLPFLVDHARRTVRIIKENIGFALATKLLFLGAALMGMATLWMAVAADMGATFIVTFNGLRLLRAKGWQPVGSTEHP